MIICLFIVLVIVFAVILFNTCFNRTIPGQLREKTDVVVIKFISKSNGAKEKYHAIVYKDRIQKGLPIKVVGNFSLLNNGRAIGMAVCGKYDNDVLKNIRAQMCSWERVYGVDKFKVLFTHSCREIGKKERDLICRRLRTNG